MVSYGCSAGAGHVEIDLTKLQADFLSVSAHKFHGPKGCGFLYVKNGFRTESLLEGGARKKASAPEPKMFPHRGHGRRL